MSAIEPLALTKKDAYRMVGSPKLVQRWLHHGWVEIVRMGGRGRATLIDYDSLKRAYTRLKDGEPPPLLPSECRAGLN